MTTMTATARPPRPRIPTDEMLAYCRSFGINPAEIAELWLDGEDVIIVTPAGIRWRIVAEGNPDGAGNTGMTLEHHPGGYPMGCPNYVPRPSAEAWTSADFNWVADKIKIPMSSGAEDGFSGYRQWLTDGLDLTTGIPTRTPGVPDSPIVRAYALWRYWASERYRGATMAEAATRSELCSRLRAEVLGSGWLSAEEAAKL